MAITWTKLWSPSDDGTVVRGVDLRNIQDDINTTGLADADAIQGVPVTAPTPADDGKALIYDDTSASFIYGSISGSPVGLMAPWAGGAAPAGWELCYGQALSRVTFADLFAAIGVTWGIGDGATTFNLPDYRGRNFLGADNMGGVSADRVTDTEADTVGDGAGTQTTVTGDHTLVIGEIPSHSHTTDVEVESSAGGTGINKLKEGPGATSTDSVGGDGAHNHPIDNVNPYGTCNVIIKST